MKNGFRYKKTNDLDFSHPGYAWAITRNAYEKIGGLYELSILGSGDHNMLLGLFGLGADSLHFKVHSGYKQSIALYESKLKMLRFGYVPTIIRNYFHGSKKNRKNTERWNILVDNGFNPLTHLTHAQDGLLIPTSECPKKLLDDILSYFVERNEDEYFK